MSLKETGKVYMVNGFPIREVKPTAWELVLVWKNGRTTSWPCWTFGECENIFKNKIHLRPDLMQRIEAREFGHNSGPCLWDANW